MEEPQDTLKPEEGEMPMPMPGPDGEMPMEEQAQAPPCVRLIIKPLVGDKFMLEMPWECRVRDLKEVIAQHWPRFKPHMHRIVLRGEELFEHRKLESLDLLDGDIIDIPQW